MTTGSSVAHVDEVSPEEAWQELAASDDAVLVDVRTRPEWQFVGLPDLSSLGRTAITLEWQRYPDMAVNEGFAEELVRLLGPEPPSRIFFICRSGARSMAAARSVAAAAAAAGQDIDCANVAEGFEGDRDDHGHRGSKNGWKVRGLAWRQY